jgi:hypothetical protein
MEKFMRFLSRFFAMLCLYYPAQLLSQTTTQIDLSRQAFNVDFRSFPTTAPFSMGTSPPTSCKVGSIFFSTSNQAGQNVLGCTVPNVWTVMGSGTSAAGTLSVMAGPSGALGCSNNVCDIVTALVPLLSSANAFLGANDFSKAGLVRLPEGPGVPTGGCASYRDVGSVFVRADAMAPQSSFYVCAQTGFGVYSWEIPGSSTSAPAIAEARELSRSEHGHSEDAWPTTYNSDGTPISAHIVRGEVSQAGASPGQVILGGQAAFSSPTSYTCTPDSPYAVVRYSTGHSFSILNASGAITHYVCFGN